MTELHKSHSYYDLHVKNDIYKCWYKNGLLHRLNEPSIECVGGKWWHKNNEFHREGDLPAVEVNGDKEWYKHGQLHRDGGLPAVEDAD